MKKIALFLSVSFILLLNSGCLKDDSCNAKTVESEQAAIVNYALANGMTTTAHSSGLHYQVINAGSGPAPTINSTVSVRYTGKLLSGTIFDSQTGTPITFLLTQVIQGWQIGMPLIQEGGTIKLILPSSLAYGCTGYGSIPPDAILYFEIELVDVQ